MKPVAGSASSLQSFLAFDFGTRRIGVASGTRLMGVVEPRGSLRGGDAALDDIARLVREWEPQGPSSACRATPTGHAHEMTEKALRFGRQPGRALPPAGVRGGRALHLGRGREPGADDVTRQPRP